MNKEERYKNILITQLKYFKRLNVWLDQKKIDDHVVIKNGIGSEIKSWIRDYEKILEEEI